MPQLEVSTFVPQLFWLAITFVILYLLMKGIGLPRVGSAIEARRRQVDDDLARAAQLKSEAEAVLAAHQETLAKARADAQAAVKETTDRMAAEAAERQRQLAVAKERALSEMPTVVAEVARSVTEKVTGAAPDPAGLAAAVDHALAE